MVSGVSRRWLLPGVVLMVGLLFLTVTLTVARSGPGLPGLTGIPTTVSFQGSVLANGQPFNGTGQFKFAIVDHAGSQAVWTNDGSNLSTAPFTPTESVPLSVTHGVFSVLLGDAMQTGMTQPLTPNVFNAPDRAVRVWFDDGVHGFQQLSPDAPLASVPFAFNAQTLGGLDSSAFTPISHTHSEYLTRTLADTLYDHRPPNMILVAPIRGDFTSIQAAINSAVSPSVSNPYLIIVAPGVYTESITLLPYVDVQGSGVNLTTITHDGSAPTVTGADRSELRSLTVINTGGGSTATGIFVVNASPTLRDLVVRVSGGVTNTGLSQILISTDAGQWDLPTYRQSRTTLVNSRIVVNGGQVAYGIHNMPAISVEGAVTNVSVTLTTTVQNSAIEVLGGASNYGIANVPSLASTGFAANNVVGIWLDLQDTAITVSGSGLNYGLYDTRSAAYAGGAAGNIYGAWVHLTDSVLTSDGSTSSFGLYRAGGNVGDARLHHSQIMASTSTITGTGGTAHIAASQLSGGPSGGIALTCAGIYDENYMFFANTCP